jgi:PAS domain S-box-containing protein
MAPPAKSNSPTKRRTAKFLRIAGEAGREGAELQEVERRLAEEARISEALHRIGISLTSELDLQKLVQAVTDEATALIGARFGAFFYNVVNERGETYLLYTLSGAPREAFAHFPMPRNTPLFGPTFRGEHVIRLADVTRDQRYGENPPYYGMPQGHLPVRSYLAASVVSRSGEVLGGLFFGHPEPEVFSERDERIVVGVAAQAAVAIDNARLYQQQQEAQQRLREQLAFTAALTHSLGEGVCACDREGRLVFVNPAAEQISGWSQEELLGNGIDEVIYAQRATDAALPRSECPLLRVIATKEVFHSDDGWFARKDGTMVPVSYTSAPILAEGQVRGTVVTFQDITVRKQAEEILRRSEERFSKIFHASPLPISIVTPARVVS